MADRTRRLWLLWLAGSAALAAVLAWTLTRGEDKALFMPGPLGDGHHQIAEACDLCHTRPWGGGEVLQQACIDCHGEDRVKPKDSHPRAKFKDPRNADRLAHIDALHCVTCHSEHRPELVGENGLTQPRDLCVHCHEDVAEERPSHEGMPFDGCLAAGCHNFHDNRALYTNFLIKHLDEPDTRPDPRRPQRQFAEVVPELEDYPLQRYPLRPLDLAAADAPAAHAGDAALRRDWLESAHARAGVNCSACHQSPAETGEPGPWIERPGPRACAVCHGSEVRAFGRGRHGMRLAAGLTPMTPARARLPMREQAADRPVDCNACHAGHRYDTRRAAARACLGCHDDEHSRAWEASPHARLWREELAGERPAGSGVPCAACHMPRVEMDVNDWMSRIVVQHNQSAVQSPNSKMIRPACLHCHGLGFTLDALADRDLVRRNFTGRPRVHVETMDLAAQEKARRDAERDAAGEDDTSMFGF